MKPLAWAAGLTLALTPLSALADSTTFTIFRKGDAIGEHRIEVTEDGDRTIAVTEIEMKVKFGPIPLFKYRHDSKEIWVGGALQSIESDTNDNGKKKTLRLTRGETAFQVEGTEYSGEAPLAAIPSSYWNKAILEAPVLIDTQDGELIELDITSLGDQPAPLAAGGEIVAEKYELRGSVSLDLWYKGADWVGAAFTVRGEDLEYALQADPAAIAATE